LVPVFSRLPAPVRRLLREQGVSSAALEELLGAPPGAAVLLAGSHAAGSAGPASDLDLMLLLEPGESASPRTAGAVRHSSTLDDEVLVMAGSLEINLQLVQAATAARLAGLAARLDAVLGRGEEAGGLPLLQPLELVFMTRLRDGIPLRNARRVNRWRRRFQVGMLPEYMVAAFFTGSLSYLEDALAEPEGRPPGLPESVAARVAAEGLLLAVLASRGATFWSVKPAASRLERLARDPGSPAALRESGKLLFPGLERARGASYAQAVLAHLEQLYRGLRQEGSMPGVVRFLESYIRGRFALDTSFLEAPASGATEA
jgi:hypothetical protein